jgi:hypothetical protein
VKYSQKTWFLFHSINHKSYKPTFVGLEVIVGVFVQFIFSSILAAKISTTASTNQNICFYAFHYILQIIKISLEACSLFAVNAIKEFIFNIIENTAPAL